MFHLGQSLSLQKAIPPCSFLLNEAQKNRCPHIVLFACTYETD